MQKENSILLPPKRTPWNKGKPIGAKPPLLARHVWSIRTKLLDCPVAHPVMTERQAVEARLETLVRAALMVRDGVRPQH